MTLILSGSNGVSDVDGTAATPAIRGTDANTGIFFPAADTLGASVGGSEGLRLTSTGLGIGTSSPSSRLDIAGSATAGMTLLQQIRTGSGNSYGFQIKGNYTTEDYIIQNYYSAALAFGTNNTERMRLDSSGNLGLGVTPSAWGSQVKAIQTTNGVYFGAFQGSAVPNLYLGANNFWNGSNWIYSGSYAATKYEQEAGKHSWWIAPSGTAGNAITFTQAMTLDASGDLDVAIGRVRAGGGSDQGTQLNMWTTGGGDGNIAAYSILFNTGANNSRTERARIDSSGNLLVGVTGAATLGGLSTTHRANISASAVWAFAVTNAAASGAVYCQTIALTGQSPNNGASGFLYCYDTTAARFYVTSNGGVNNYQANNTNLSDRREKTNFAPAGEYLSKICAIPVQTFNYIDQNVEEDPGTTLGVVAQDVQAVAPELVKESNWGSQDEPKMRLSVYQTDLQYALMKCIQEQQAIITALTERVTALEAK